MIKLKSLNGLVAVNIILMVWTIFLLAIFKGLGGTELLFLIIGNISGWMGAIVYFFFRKPPTP